MRPFFSYYGGKWRGSKHYGPPRRDPVIEPFAGSACYSLYWDCPNVKLYDLSTDICHAWDWLINCSEEDVMGIPDYIKSNEEWLALPDGPRQVVHWNVAFGQATMGKSLKKWYLHYANTGEMMSTLAAAPSMMIWNERAKRRIIEQKPKIANWTIDNMDYRDIPLVEAHWHVDPPYQGKPGRAYTHDSIDYAHLSEWCRNLPGAADVCENEGADWLPFETLYETHTSGSSGGVSKRTKEVLWRKGSDDLFEI